MRATDLPASTLPVIEIIAIPGCADIAAPMTEPEPHTTLRTPGGRTPSSICANRTAVTGVMPEGLRITVLPVASAGPSFHVAMLSG